MKKETISISELLEYKMESEPLVSVIIPVYNVEKYLCRCLDSVLAQSYENIEIILVDDGSTDNSGRICDEYACKDKRIRVIHQGNGGQSVARNKGVERASGDYISFIDSDDFVVRDYIKVMVAVSHKFQSDIVQTRILITQESADTDLPIEDGRAGIVIYDPAKYAPNDYRYKVAPCAKLLKTSIVKENLFPHYKANEDDATYYRFSYCAKKICIVDIITYFYYQTPDSVMRASSSHDGKTEYIPIYYERISYFEKKHEPELVLGSRERFCLILLLNYAAYRRNGTNIHDRPRMLEIFREQFPYLKEYNNVSFLRRCVYWMFYHFPNLTSFVIGLIRK